MIIRTFLALLLCALSSKIAAADAVYWNYGIASVQVGWDKQHRGPVGYKISFVGLGPDNASRKLATCIELATRSAGETSQKPLDNYILDATQVADRMIDAKERITADTLRARFKAETDKTEVMIAYAELVYRGTVVRCMSGDESAGRLVQLGIVSRLCVTWAPVGNVCKQARDPVGRNQDPATGRYAKVYDWLASRGALRPLNQIVQLVGDNGSVKEIQPDLRDRYYLPAPTETEAQRQFEDGAERFRRKAWRYDYVAPGVVKIDKSVALALVDTLDHPAFIVPKLLDARRPLLAASNEVARTRLRECMLYQGNVELSVAASCAGVRGPVEILAACVQGARCVPDLAERATRAALIFAEPLSLSDMARGSLLPRVLGGATFEQYKTAARLCAQTTSNQIGFNYCLLKTQLNGADAVALQCLETNGIKGAARCVSGGLGNSPEARAAKCVLEADDDRAKALCLASETSPRAAQAYQCYQDNIDNREAAAACIASANLSPEAKAAVACATQSPKDYGAIGACLVSRNLSGDAQRLVGCYASANGNWVGAAACLAGGALSAEQKILLQCATQTGMEPLSFAACTGGMLALKEFQQCRNKGFGEDECFGENNEIRKFVRNIGLGDISGDTVVGQYASLHLDALKTTVSVAEGLLVGAGRIVEGFGEVGSGLLGALDDFYDQRKKDVCNLVGVVCDAFHLSETLPLETTPRWQDNWDDKNGVRASAARVRSHFTENNGIQIPCDPASTETPNIFTPCGSSMGDYLGENYRVRGSIFTLGTADVPPVQRRDLKAILENVQRDSNAGFKEKQALAREAFDLIESSKDGTVLYGGKEVAIPVQLPPPPPDRLLQLGIHAPSWLFAH